MKLEKTKKERGVWIPQNILSLKLNSSTKILLGFIRYRRSCNYTNNKIANILGESESTIKRSLKTLRDGGFITSIIEGKVRILSSRYEGHNELLEGHIDLPEGHIDLPEGHIELPHIKVIKDIKDIKESLSHVHTHEGEIEINENQTKSDLEKNPLLPLVPLSEKLETGYALSFENFEKKFSDSDRRIINLKYYYESSRTWAKSKGIIAPDIFKLSNQFILKNRQEGSLVLKNAANEAKSGSNQNYNEKFKHTNRKSKKSANSKVVLFETVEQVARDVEDGNFRFGFAADF